MELSELQVPITVLFLITAVVIVVVCNTLRNKSPKRIPVRAHSRERAPQVRVVEPAWQACEVTASPAGGSLAAEIAALANLGMQEEDSAWRKASDDAAEIPAPAKPAEECKAVQLQPVMVDEFLFELLVSGRSMQDFPSGPALPPVEAKYELIPAPVDGAMPRGMIDQGILRRVLSVGRPFSGVAISIAMNEDETGRRTEGHMEWVCAYIAGLLNDHEFACRTGKEEFLIVCPGAQGFEAQQRLNDVSERLWEFQLRGIGAHSVRFNWGGVEVQNQPLAYAIASATERMRVTKRMRNPIFFDSVNVRRKIV